MYSPCKVKRAANDSGTRDTQYIKRVVIHSAEGTSAAGVASYFARPTTRASTHLAVDDKECWRMLPDNKVPWGASGANYTGLHIEICGYARWSPAEWKRHKRMLDHSAYLCALWCKKYDIPARWLKDEDIKGPKKGFTYHAQVNRVYKKGSHWDPGPGFTERNPTFWVRSYFIHKVRQYLRRM